MKINEKPMRYFEGIGYKDVKPKVDKETLEYIYPKCVMCLQNKGKVLAPETNEVLCAKCEINNNEARVRNFKED